MPYETPQARQRLAATEPFSKKVFGRNDASQDA
jgi:hypothetical protein